MSPLTLHSVCGHQCTTQNGHLVNDSCHCNQRKTGRQKVQTVGIEAVLISHNHRMHQNQRVSRQGPSSFQASSSALSRDTSEEQARTVCFPQVPSTCQQTAFTPWDSMQRARGKSGAQMTRLSQQALCPHHTSLRAWHQGPRPHCTTHTCTQSCEAERRGGTARQHGGDCGWHFLSHTPLKSQKVIA